MKIIGEDTQEFLDNHVKIQEYLTVLDIDFSAQGVNENYIVLTNIGFTDEVVTCVCFYFTNIPVSFTFQKSADILADHAEALHDLDALIHICSTAKSDIETLLSDSSMENREALFSRTVRR